jgi:hypothetical protein
VVEVIIGGSHPLEVVVTHPPAVVRVRHTSLHVQGLVSLVVVVVFIAEYLILKLFPLHYYKHQAYNGNNGS